ncbi:MAG: class I SAM-dependent rRNA methyltransferase [Spirochaetales bacterium]|nr:class I SAM-dependent rRNA methyltransferase [Spirochaetales bacterium]
MHHRIRVILKPREEDRLVRGHPWVYDNEIARVLGSPVAGDSVALESARGRFLGSALWSPRSKIRARRYTDEPRSFEEHLPDALERALALRATEFDRDRESFRVAFGEADALPGLIVDRFVGETPDGSRGVWLSVQILAAGMAAHKDAVVERLVAALSPDGIMERSEAPVLAFEGLESTVGALAGSVPPSVTILENGLRFEVDLASGQKTGWFLDQARNRAAAARYAKDARVLDAFCNQGGFGLACAAAGASSVLAVDSSAPALAAVAANAARNGLADRVATRAANAFDLLRELERSDERYGLIILDPPAFAKNKASVKGALRGYKDINLRAMKLLEPGGRLVTCSCSSWVDRDTFMSTVADAAADARRRFRVLEERPAAPDHPALLGYPESRYLKCAILQAL